METGVAQLLEHVPAGLEIDPDPEQNDEQQPGTFATPENPTGTSKRYTGNYLVHQRLPICVETDFNRRERQRMPGPG